MAARSRAPRRGAVRGRTTWRERAAAAMERGAGAFVRGARRVPGLRAIALSPVIARPGYWFATGCALVWGGILGGFRFSRQGGMIVARGLPAWAFGRGGTVIGAVYLTSHNITPSILEHEAVHRAQWRRYGLAMIPLYLAAGRDARRNRFEIEADLRKGGYVSRRASDSDAAP